MALKTKYGYRKLLALPERIAVDNYAMNDALTADQKATLKTLAYDFQVAEAIDLNDPDVVAGTTFLEACGLIAAGRAAQILANQTPA